MSGLSRGVAPTMRPILRSCIPSTSRIQQPRVRSYATVGQDAGLPETSGSSDEPVFGTTQPKREETAIVKRMWGKGIPQTNNFRHVIRVVHPHLWKHGPITELTYAKRKTGGRSRGKKVNRNIGGGHKQRIRIVDFWRYEPGIHDVIRIEYDPGRTAHIALIRKRGESTDVPPEQGAILAEQPTQQKDGKSRHEVRGGWSYILAPDGLRAGDTVLSYRKGIPAGTVEGWDGLDPDKPDLSNLSTRALGLLRTHTVRPGNVLPLYLIPAGTVVHNLSLDTGGRMQLCRAAGACATIVAHHSVTGENVGGTDVFDMGHLPREDGTFTKARGTVLVKLQSGEIRKIAPGAIATIGVVSNKEHQQRSIGTAGRARRMGRRPTVRGVAMNATDHPMGGGKGKSKRGKTGISATGIRKFVRTRKPRMKKGNKAVVLQRPIRGIQHPGPAAKK
ncbi:translation protein SH3-like domain-containing protein [Naematelia encephala]|uniref:Translation protein SH3-like domain-containing protein n=1 Tax=Naematelia encephala TaxID=71784 RepID=A0A1Y2BJ78_9TREE|nr:translation protein SH3-like domain-containing protein [Naematelia encephala]